MATQEYPTNGIDRCAYYHADLATAMANVPESANIVGRDWLPSKYGVDDQIGAANLITSQKVLDALCSGWSGSTFIWLMPAGWPTGREPIALAASTPRGGYKLRVA